MSYSGGSIITKEVNKTQQESSASNTFDWKTRAV